MCCFSGSVDVSNTRIFARLDGRGRQYLVYEMSYATDDAVAMILPLPVSSHREDAIDFISFEHYPDFFEDLHYCIEPPSKSRSLAVAAAGGMLAVHDVGAYEASFVPTLDDFDRLDQRFKLPRQVWDRIPLYQDYGFAVFKLRTADHAGLESTENPRIKGLRAKFRPEVKPAREWMQAHPMAFRFPTRNPKAVFFPTVHIHDGEVHAQERFDHALYLQGDEAGRSLMANWFGVRGSVADDFVDVDDTQGVVDGTLRCYRAQIRGYQPNQDIWIAG
jgi:hypothetical protein